MLTTAEIHMLLALLIGEAEVTDEYLYAYHVDGKALVAKLQAMREAAAAGQKQG